MPLPIIPIKQVSTQWFPLMLTRMFIVPEHFNFDGKVVTDLYGSYKFSKQVTLFVGADNLFNVHPDIGVNPLAKGWAGDNESGGPWDSVQMGFNGMRLFAKLSWDIGK